MRILLLTLGVAISPASSEAVAQARADMPDVQSSNLRSDVPDVMGRRIETDPDQNLRKIFNDFGSWYRRAGAPKMLFFWNRELTDDSSSRYRTVNRSVSAVASRPGLAVGATESTQEDELTTGGKYNALHPEESADLESSFLNAFLGTGANILDRRALMRKVSTRQDKGDRSDQQFMESQALEQGVDYLVEILPDHADDSETGFVFTIKITHLPSSSVKTQFRTTALPTAGPARLVAGSGGFERKQDTRRTLENVARALAAETMRKFY